MDSSGSLERMSGLRLALQTPSPSSSRLPASEGYASGAAARLERARRPQRAGDSGQVVLLIEDDPAVVTAVAECLHKAGYATLCAVDVQDAVDKVHSRPVALVLLNWGLLSRIGGSQLITRLRSSSPRSRLPMVVISDNATALNEASSLGIEDYLLDPLQLDDLLHVVDEHCG
jgi:CheY-like chemotaxis protein